MATILCVEQETAIHPAFQRTLADLGHTPVLVADVEHARAALRDRRVDLVVCDLPLLDAEGHDALEVLHEQAHDVPIIAVTGFASADQAALCLRRGAVDYVTRPIRREALRLAVNNAIEIGRLRRENESFRREIGTLQGPRCIVGSSDALRHALEVIEAAAPTRATVLIEGESGTGKELFARAIHDRSPRRAHPLVTVNCAALPGGLVESTLLGHERGAFTGAVSRSIGAFERAHQGTLLLDEISELAPELQAKLLRVIQEQEFERVGGGQTVQVDVRLVATTNRDLLAEVEAGRFRRDLYFRLSVVPLHAPALRERLEDIPALVAHFVRVVSLQLGRRAPEVPADTLRYLQGQEWPGNVRELANAVERAVILCPGDRLRREDFGAGVQGLAPMPSRLPDASPPPEPISTLNLRAIERQMIRRALESTRGHRARAAALLGISERTLREKLRRLPLSATG